MGENRLFDTGFLPSWPWQGPGANRRPVGIGVQLRLWNFHWENFFPWVHCWGFFFVFLSFFTSPAAVWAWATSGSASERSAKALTKRIAKPGACKRRVFVGTGCVWMLFSLRDAFNSLILEPSLGRSEAAELFMDATSNRAGRKSLLCSLLAWVTFERMLVRMGQRLQWAGNHYTKPSVLHGAPQPPLLLATSSTSLPLTSGEGVKSRFLRRAAHFFALEKKKMKTEKKKK